MALSIISLLLGVVVFLTGMRLLSSGLKKIAGKGIKNLFTKKVQIRKAIKEKAVIITLRLNYLINY